MTLRKTISKLTDTINSGFPREWRKTITTQTKWGCFSQDTDTDGCPFCVCDVGDNTRCSETKLSSLSCLTSSSSDTTNQRQTS